MIAASFIMSPKCSLKIMISMESLKVRAESEKNGKQQHCHGGNGQVAGGFDGPPSSPPVYFWFMSLLLIKFPPNKLKDSFTNAVKSCMLLHVNAFLSLDQH